MVAVSAMIPDAAIQHLPSRGRLRASVLLLHGYAARAAVHLGDAAPFVDAGVEVVLPDAPGHGARDDGRLARIAALSDDERRAEILAIARTHADELPGLAAWCRRRGASRVAVVGISMGGFAALRSLLAQPPFHAIAAVLAAPTLVDRWPGAGAGPPVLLGLAGRDGAVHPEPGRRFARHYGAELHEYPDSEHLMRPEDWADLWRRVTAFVRRNLAGG